RTTTPIAAGPGLPRAPPSTFTVSFGIESAVHRAAVRRLVTRRRDHDDATVVRRGVPLARGGVDLVELEAPFELVDRAQLVTEVDAPLVPGQLPGDGDADHLGGGGEIADRDRGRAERAGEPGDGAPGVRGVEAGDGVLEAARRRKVGLQAARAHA